MNKADLRKRLANMRDLLSSNQLTPETKKALRDKLAAERTVLRNQVGDGSRDNRNNAANLPKDRAGNGAGNNDVVVKVVLSDRRPSRDLREDELRRRINVYREAIADARYSERERQEWRVILENDRVFMRDRLLDDRRRRQGDLQARAKSGDIKINLDLNFRPDRPPPPRSVFAAEADDAEIEDILAAPPRQKIDRRYTIEEVETNPDLRDAVARIEIDTVHFGFGEGFLREEEVINLDRIAEVMEKILAVNPGEVFMIEGHTDAVGSDPANRQLSRERATAVKEALTTYYVIPDENLKTVGFGERYLKIPTSEPEAENRRVSVARITPLVGALDN
jgi:outer membrane protein OmpA-like peptidoglycan-associated protein